MLTFARQRVRERAGDARLDVVLAGDVVNALELKGRGGTFVSRKHAPLFAGLAALAPHADVYWLRGNHDYVVPGGPWRAGEFYANEALRVLAEHGAIETLIPGHGRIAEGRDEVLARFQTDLDYLAALERGVQEAVGRGETLATAQETLATMNYTGRGSTTTPTDTFHRENVRFAYQAAGPTRP